MGSGINQTNTHAGPVASMLFSRDRDDEESLRRTNPTIGIDGLERSQLTFSSLASGLHNTFPWQSSYCPTSSFLDSGFSASTMQAMDVHHRQTLFSLWDRDFARRAISLNHESLNQLQLERYNRFRLDSSSNGSSSRRSSDINARGFVADPRAGTMMDTSLESTSTRQLSSLPVGRQISDQALLDGKFHTDASNHATALSLAGARAHQEFMLQANQIPFGPTGARFAGVMSRSSSDIGGASRFGGLGKIDYSHRVQPGGTTSATPPKDSKNGEGSTISGCEGLSLASVVRNNPPSDHDVTNYHSHSTIHRGLPVLRSDADIHSYHRSPPTHSPSEADHSEQAVNAASVTGDKKLSSPRSHLQNDNSMDSRRKKDKDTPSKRKHEAKSLQSTKKNKPREGAKVPLSNKRRKRGDQCNEESASHGSRQTRKSWGKEETCNASVLEEEDISPETRQKLAENLCLDSAAGRGYHPQLRQIDEEQRNLHHAILADQECIRSCLLRNTLPVLPLQYHRSRYPYLSTRALLENVTSAFFPPRGSSALGSIGVLFGADSDPTFGCRISQSLPSAEEQLPEETYSGAMERPFRDSNAPGQVYPSAREGEGSRDFARRGRCFPLHIREDENNLSSYQVLARKQIEVFEASIEEARTNAQGRNRPIQPGEIGIRCRHCAKLSPKDRITGAVYYPKKLDGVYQTAQKMAVNHLVDRCQEIPEETKQRLRSLKDTTRSSDGGGKRYWAEALRTLGVRELDSGGLVWNE